MSNITVLSISMNQVFRKIDNKRALDADDPTIEVLTSSDDDAIL